MNKVLDLFCGAGGMAEGFIRAGFTIPYASDISEQAKMTYVNRHKKLGIDVVFLNDDLNNIINNNDVLEVLKKENFDVVIGGPPCQGFSNAGKRCQKDKRNLLVKSYLEMIKVIYPNYFVMENVTGINSFIFDEFIGLDNEVYVNEKAACILEKEFKKLGYEVNKVLLDASDYGVPQSRKRVFFLGSKLGLEKVETPIKSKEKVSAYDALNDLMTGVIETKYQKESISGRTPNVHGETIERDKILNDEKSKHAKLTVDRFKLILEGESLKSAFEKMSDADREKYKTKKNNCKRLDRNLPAPTVVTLPDDYIHYSEHRIMSVRELARLQSFDDSFEFLGKRTTGGHRRKMETPQYTLVGNAVPPLLAYAIACSVKEAIDKNGEYSKFQG